MQDGAIMRKYKYIGVFTISILIAVFFFTANASIIDKLKNIVGIKEASGNLKNMTEIIQFTPDDFVLLSGDDFLTLPIMSIGGKGVISVTANVVPERVHMFTQLCLEGKFTEAQKMNYEIYELSMAMFIDTNPIPVKEALNLMGFDMGEPRLPLVKLGEEKREKLKGILKKYGVI